MSSVEAKPRRCVCVRITADRTIVPEARRMVCEPDGTFIGTSAVDCPECRGTGFPVPSLVVEQAPPVPNGGRPVWEIAIERDEAAYRRIERKGGEEIARPDWDAYLRHCRERDAEGRRKYGVPLQSHNGRDPLVDALQEALDLRVYLEQAYIESGEDEALRDLPIRMVADEARYLALRVERLILRRDAAKPGTGG